MALHNTVKQLFWGKCRWPASSITSSGGNKHYEILAWSTA